MRKIAMLNCLNANQVCTGAGCMKAFYERRASFERYQGEEVVCLAFARCSECRTGPEHPGMKEKLERLVKEGVEVVHIGVCTKNREGARCPNILEDAAWLEAHGIEVVWGTH